MLNSTIKYILFVAISFGIGMVLVNKLSNNDKVVDKVMSYDQEKQLGSYIYQNSIASGKSGKLLSDHYTDSIIAVVLKRLTDNLENSQYEYTVEILESPQPNAYTIPGGHIFFYTTMFDYMDNPEQFAAVLAHEIGHNENRHMVKRLIESFGKDFLLSLSPSTLTSVMTTLDNLSYSRKQEDQADHFAYQLMIKAGIHPKYFAEVMESFDQLGEGQDPPEILSDHPDSARRAKEAIDYSVPPGFVEIPFDNLNWFQMNKHVHDLSASNPASIPSN